ncbi:MAG: NUDIX domain-containing protein [Coleofasciculaceae cyanobacterium]
MKMQQQPYSEVFCSETDEQRPPVQYGMIDAETYKITIAMLPVVTVDVLPFREDFTEVLLLNRVNKPAQNQYYSPGGRLLKNEEFADGAVRQFKRELGLDINEKDLIAGGVINEIWQDSSFEGVNYHSVNVFFGYSLRHSQLLELTLDFQHSHFKWFNVEDSSIHPKVQQRIEIIKQNFCQCC